MWESLLRLPHGRTSVRNFIAALTAFLVVCFAYILVAAPTAHAADALWDQDESSQMWQLKYNNNSYSGPYTAVETDGLKLVTGTYYYVYAKDAKAYVIYFAPGASPPKATTATYTAYSYNGTVYSNPIDKKSITVTPMEEQPEGSLTGCSIEGIGWLVCPLTRHLAKGMDWIYGVISEFLAVQPLRSTQADPLYRTWDISRNLANIGFVIAFLIMIYGQITGGLMSNYTVKKILPRVVITAILVNASYLICSIGIDLSNILGYSVQDLLTSAQKAITEVPMKPITWENATEIILTGGTGAFATGVLGMSAFTATGGGIAAAIYLLIPALVGVIVSALVALIVLAMRQAIITILVILAPLAFAAYLLPNTEKWFQRWRETLMTMILMFPIFSVVFGGAQLAGTAIIQNAKSPAVAILGMVVIVAPLVITPMIIKFSGSLLGRIAGMVNNPSKGLIDRTRNWSKPRAEEHRDKVLARPNKGLSRFGAGRLARRMNRKEINRQQRHEGYKKEAENRAHEWEAHKMKGGPEPLRNAYNRRQERKEYGYWDATYRDAELRHKQIETHHDRRYNEAMINAPAGSVGARRYDMNIATAVDAGVAAQAKSLVDNAGEVELQETILASNALKKRATLIHEYEGRASQAKGLIEDEGKAHWEKLSLDDRTIYSRQLERQANAKNLKALQDEWESILAEASAGRTNDYQEKFGPVTAQVSDSIQKIQTANETITVEAKRKANAEFVFQTELNTKLKQDDVLLNHAAGIDPNGRTKVIAQLYKEGTNLYMQNVEAVESTFSNEGYAPEELIKVYQKGELRDGQEASEMHIHAAMRQMLSEKGNNTSVQKMSEFVGSQGMKYDAATESYTDADTGAALDADEVERRRNLQQIFVDALNKSPHAVTHVSGTDRAAMQTGTYRQSTRSAIIRDIRDGKIKTDRIGKMDIDEMLRSVQVFRDYPADLAALPDENRLNYIETINTAMDDPIIGAKLEPRHRKMLAAMKAYLDPADHRSNADKNALAGRPIPVNFDPMTLADT